MRTVTTHYAPVKQGATKHGYCPVCGKGVQRSRTFEQTVSPFNKTADGQVKTPGQIREELNIEVKNWEPDFTHEGCKS